jgi:hypothetical protein
MRKLGSLIAAVLLLGLAAGCNTVMHGSAPAREGYIYVVGSRQNRPTVWLCPNAPKKGECQVVEVNVEED